MTDGGRASFGFPAPTVEARADTFAPYNLSDAELELANVDLSDELD
jgi:hypothetical protein